MSDGPEAADARVLEALGGWAAATGPREDAPPPAQPRSVAEGAAVELVEVTSETVRAVCRLTVAADQAGFVAPNAISFAEALFEPKAWYRAIHADGVPVGFLMLHDDPDEPAYHLWRFMIDARFQGKGYGARAVELLVEHVRSRPGATELTLSWVPGPGSPEGFYRRFGFEPTGKIDDGEVVARLEL
jgi:diamine N-acetyltransferase